MSRYSKLALLLAIGLTSVSCVHLYDTEPIKKSINYEEDLYMMLALDSENIKNHQNSLVYYQKLYTINKQKAYANKIIKFSYLLKNFKLMQTIANEAINIFPKQKEFYTQQYIIALLSDQKIDFALIEAINLLKEFNTNVNYEIVANVYYAKGDYKNALVYYESAYAKSKTEKTILKLTHILYTYLDKKDVALAYLETYIQTIDCSALVCDRLMLIYQEQGNIDGMLSILYKMHTKYNTNPALKKTTKMIQNIIVSLLEKKGTKYAIEYLEKNDINKIKLLNLYEQNGNLKKALSLTRVLYLKLKKPELLGRIAMLEFELAIDKRSVMKHVVANFELALSSGINNSSYQNYYGYLLIDYELDIQKGIDLVISALATSPKNIAYMDSLAWGYFKLNKCKKAYSIMSSVVHQTGLKDSEIKHHWNKIRNCKEIKKVKNDIR